MTDQRYDEDGNMRRDTDDEIPCDPTHDPEALDPDDRFSAKAMIAKRAHLITKVLDA